MAAEIHPSETSHSGVVDVSELPTNRVQQYVQGVDEVYFERKGGRTFLVTV